MVKIADRIQLFEKTKIAICPIFLTNVNLNDLSGIVARALKIPSKKVIIVGVYEDRVDIDILVESTDIKRIVGLKRMLLRKISRVPGVSVFPNTAIESEGVLGFANLGKDRKKSLAEKSRKSVAQITRKIKNNSIIFSTGVEIQKGLVRDTNSIYIQTQLRKIGFSVQIGPVLPDDPVVIRGFIRNAAEEGLGLIITTGGIGGEEKDKTIEALVGLDPRLSIQYTMKFSSNGGIHPECGVRIAVGNYLGSRMIALPGPYTEVKTAMEVVLKGLMQNWEEDKMAYEIAQKLKRELLGF